MISNFYPWHYSNMTAYPYIISYFDWIIICKALFAHRYIRSIKFMIIFIYGAIEPHHNIIANMTSTNYICINSYIAVITESYFT